jgi:hypothetical protein
MSARVLEAQLCDAGVRAAALASLKVERLLRIDTSVAVLFVSDFLLSDWLAALRTLHSQRPDLALVCVARHFERHRLWQAFQDSPFPPLVLRDPSPPAIICDALRIVHDACATETLQWSSEPLATRQMTDALAEVARALTAREQLRDHAFDRLLPIRLRAASDKFWTPLDVIRRAGAWFDELGVTSVVDIGSGAGKFCIAGALVSSCCFIGIEQRPQLATVARNLARLLKVEHRVSIIDGRFGEIETPVADCYYFYNPFEENLFSAAEGLDDAVELSPERFRRDLRSFRALVASLPRDAYILTYNGVGGRLPACLKEVRTDRSLPAVLRLLQKVE